MKIAKVKTEKGAPPKIAAVKRAPGEFQILKADVLLRSPTNPRKTFAEVTLRDLAENIGQYGIKQPLLVRPLPRFEIADPDLITPEWSRLLKDGQEIDKGPRNLMEMVLADKTKGRDGKEFEIVCGERRDRAAEIAGLTERPCMVENLDDQAVVAIQLIENLQREDLTALDEAAGYASLMKELNLTAEGVADLVGKGRSHVYAKLALLKLCPAVKAAVDAGKIDGSVAELIGRFKTEKEQARALKKVTDAAGYLGYASDEEEDEADEAGAEQFPRDKVSYRKAQLLLRDGFTKELKGAPFDQEKNWDLILSDAPLARGKRTVEGVTFDPDPNLFHGGPCAACPHRSGNCGEEWPEIKSPDVCTMPSCFAVKTELDAAAKLAKFREQGFKVVSAKEAQKYLEIGETMYVGNSYRTPKDVLKGKEPTAVMLKNGKPVKVFAKADMQAKFKLDGNGQPSSADRLKAETQRLIDVNLAREMVAAIMAALGKQKDLKAGLLVLLEAWPTRRMQTAIEERGAAVESMNAPELLALLVDGSLRDWGGYDYAAAEQAARSLGIDVKKLGKDVAAEVWQACELPKDGADFEADQATIDAFAKHNSCADIDKGKIKEPLLWRGRMWACAGSMSSGKEGNLEVDLYLCVPAGEFKGQLAIGQNLDPKGDGNQWCHGIKVAYQKDEYVLSEPRVRLWRPEKKEKTELPAKGAKGKAKMSAADRAKLAAKARARWAKVKAKVGK